MYPELKTLNPKPLVAGFKFFLFFFFWGGGGCRARMTGNDSDRRFRVLGLGVSGLGFRALALGGYRYGGFPK